MSFAPAFAAAPMSDTAPSPFPAAAAAASSSSAQGLVSSAQFWIAPFSSPTIAAAAASSSSLCRRVSGLSLAAADGSAAAADGSAAAAAATPAAASSVAAAAAASSSSVLRAPRRRKLKTTALPSFFRPVPRAIVGWARRRALASVREDARSRSSQPRQVASRLKILQRCFQQQDAELGLPHMPTDLLSIVAGYSARSEYELREVVSVRAMTREFDPASEFEFSSEAEFRAFVARSVVEEPRLQQCLQELESELEDAERSFDQSHPASSMSDADGSQESDGSAASSSSSLSISSAAADRAEMRDQVSLRFFESFAHRYPSFRSVLQRCYPAAFGLESSAPYRDFITRMLPAADPATPLHDVSELWKEWSGRESVVWIGYRQDE